MKSQSRRSYDRRRCNMADADEIAKLCYDRFESLPRRGKPEPGREWTLLAAVLQITRCTNTDTVKKEVISLGTGTKCIGQTQMSPNGDVLNDSHAEVIARRGCIRYLIQELLKAVKDGKSSVFCPADEKGKWKLQSGVSFVFFTSHTPCGDASIIPMSDGESQPCVAVASEKAGDLKRKAEEPIERQNAKLPRLREQMDPTSEDAKKDQSQSDEAKKSEVPDVPDVHRTGAKCVPGGLTDPLHPGIGYHSTGVLRVKPGRGEPTLSLSCSDKMAQWTVLGFQGALLSHYLQEALYFSIIVVGKCPYNREVMERALITRCSHISNLPAGFSVTPPLLLQSSLEFPFSQAQTELRHQAGRGRISPCGAAISWCNVADQPLDVTANGYKHGVTKKALGTAKARSLLCKVELFHNFLSLVSATELSQLPDSLRKRDLQTYWDYKEASRSYQHAWQQLHGPRGFSLWPRSDRNFLLFC